MTVLHMYVSGLTQGAWTGLLDSRLLMHREGAKGRLHPYCLARKFHLFLQLRLAKLRGGTMKETPSFRAMTGSLSYCKVGMYLQLHLTS